MVYGVKCHFHQYFSYIMAVSIIFTDILGKYQVK